VHFALPALTAPVLGLGSRKHPDAARSAPHVEREQLTFLRIDECSPGNRTAPEYRA
jgi:hypothetical protein